MRTPPLLWVNVVYCIGAVAMQWGVLAVVARSPRFASWVSQGLGARQWRVQALAAFLALLLNRAVLVKVHVVPGLLAGWILGWRGALLPGLAVALQALVQGGGWAWAGVVGLSGAVGAACRRLPRPLAALAFGLLAAAWHTVVFGTPLNLYHTARLAELNAHDLGQLLAVQAILVGGATASTLLVVDSLAQGESRRAAQVLTRLLPVLNELFRGGDGVGEPLCQSVARAVQGPCLLATPEGRLVLSPDLPVHHLDVSSPIWTKALGERVSFLGDHRLALQCHDRCRLSEVALMPVHDGNSVRVMLGLLATHQGSLGQADRSLLDGMASLLSVHFVEERVRRQRALLEDTRVRFLTAQIKPHFLFNALNTIASLLATAPEKVPPLVDSLAHFLRQSFSISQDWVPLREEVGYLHAYLEVEKARFEERLQVHLQIPADLEEMQVPTMVLEPLVENAVQHGISRKSGGGTVWVAARREEGAVRFEVRDDGLGFPVAVDGNPERLPASPTRGNGVALSNLRQRLEMLVPGGPDFRVKSAPGQGTSIAYRVPLGARP